METRHIGALEVSVVGLGCNNFGGRLDAVRTADVVSAALDAGITLFDTADIYGGTLSEVYLGQALGRRRDEVVVATKFGVPYEGHEGGGSPAYVRRALDDSLRRLGIDHVDLYQQHFPDPSVPVQETLGVLGELVAEGKVREIGCSNVDAAWIRAADELGAPRLASVQNQYNLLHREPEREVLVECERRSIGFLPYYPLASGVLSGKYEAGGPPPTGTRIAGLPPAEADRLLSESALATVGALGDLAAAEGRSVLDLAIAWLVAQPAVASVIAGAMNAAQVLANVAGGRWRPGAALLARVDEVAPAR